VEGRASRYREVLQNDAECDYRGMCVSTWQAERKASSGLSTITLPRAPDTVRHELRLLAAVATCDVTGMVSDELHAKKLMRGNRAYPGCRGGGFAPPSAPAGGLRHSQTA
jgi:hypothetical protein